MNDWIAAVILGVVEGLTEFLPISSTGHMILCEPVLGLDFEEPKWRVFLFVSQFGAILAVIGYFWHELWRQIISERPPQLSNHILVKLFAAMIPTGILGLLLDDFMETHLLKPLPVAIALIVGAVLIEIIDRRCRRTDENMTLADVTIKQAVILGFCQCIAMWPGTSRSGATIMGGLVMGLTPKVAAEFSFFLAIPTMLAAAAKQLLDYHQDLSRDNLGMILLGTFVSFVVAWVVIAWFMNYIRTKPFTIFSVYRVVLGLVVIGWWVSARGS